MNISIIGSSHTRDIFEAKRNKLYEDKYKVSSYIPMVSMLSIMSAPEVYNYRRLAMLDLENSVFERMFYDFEKNVINSLESIQPDVLVLDFYADARYGAMSYGSSYITNEISDLIGKGIIIGKNLGITYSYNSNTEDYVMVWRNYFDRFMSYISDNMPEMKVVINAMKMPDSYMNMISECSDKDIEMINNLWNRFDNYAIKKYNLKYIMKDATYLIDSKEKKYMQGNPNLYFKKDYYIRAYKEFKVVANNIKITKIKESHKNLIIDSAFNNQFDFWSNVIGEYKFVKYRKYYGIQVVESEEAVGNHNPQLWTRAIEIEGNGETEYTLSFYIKIPDVEKINKNLIVFRIRTFDDIKSIKADDTVDWYRLTLEEHDIKSDEEYRYVFKFKPKGRYIKLAPFLGECIPGVEYSRIKLERSSVESKYSR